VAVIGSDKFALKWGPLPVLLGIVAYFLFPRKQTGAAIR
jgi:hypothetical protein